MTPTFKTISAAPIAGSLGAEISGVNLSSGLDDATFSELRQALLMHQVIVLREQTVTPQQQLALARRFGSIHLHPYIEGMPEHPEIIALIKTETDTLNFGGGWHTDQMFTTTPPMATMLYARQIPPVGGDTLFANLYQAYDALSSGMQRLVDGLYTVNTGDAGRHRGSNNGGSLYQGYSGMTVKDPGDVQTEAQHPLVRTHPETGRKALYIGLHTHRFADMTEAESKPLLGFLMDHVTRPEFTCRLRWQVNTLALWDNRCVLHNALNDYPGQRREMHRITIAGDQPF